jgi:hypothetical protein
MGSISFPMASTLLFRGSWSLERVEGALSGSDVAMVNEYQAKE